MGKYSRLIFYWLPPVIWMFIIFYLSSRMRVAVTGTFFLDFLFFKSLHVAEYAILYFLFFRAFYTSKNQRLTINNKLFFPLIISVFYALSDEIHQTYVPTREGKVRDVFIDTAGILLMYIYIKHNILLIKKLIK